MTFKNGNGMSTAFSQMEELAAVPYSFRSREKVQSCSFIFWLNYGATSVILITASIAVTMKQFGGRPIECVVDKDLNVEVVNNFCWVHSTFSSWKVLDSYNDTKLDGSQEIWWKSRKGHHDPREPVFMMENGRFKLFRAGQLKGTEGFRTSDETSNMDRVAQYYPGNWHSLGPYPGVETVDDESFLRYHKYVQWVAGILAFQRLVLIKEQRRQLECCPCSSERGDKGGRQRQKVLKDEKWMIPTDVSHLKSVSNEMVMTVNRPERNFAVVSLLAFSHLPGQISGLVWFSLLFIENFV